MDVCKHDVWSIATMALWLLTRAVAFPVEDDDMVSAHAAWVSLLFYAVLLREQPWSLEQLEVQCTTLQVELFMAV